jgi:hypothetical protein
VLTVCCDVATRNHRAIADWPRGARSTLIKRELDSRAEPDARPRGVNSSLAVRTAVLIRRLGQATVISAASSWRMRPLQPRASRRSHAVLADGIVVGRIFKVNASPVGRLGWDVSLRLPRGSQPDGRNRRHSTRRTVGLVAARLRISWLMLAVGHEISPDRFLADSAPATRPRLGGSGPRRRE